MKIIAILLSLLSLHAQAWAAATLDAVTFNSKSAVGTTLTQSHTVTALGGNRVIYVLCGTDNATEPVLTATYAGAAMQEVILDTDSTAPVKVVIFRKTNPATGANDWVVTQDIATGMVCYGRSLTNVNQVTPETDSDSECSDGTPGTSRTLTLTTAAGEILLDVLAQGTNGATAVAQGANQTDEITDGGVDNTSHRVAGSSQAGADGGVMSWGWTGSQHNCLAAVSIKNSDYSLRRPGRPIILP